jgi:hypothetical protein
MSITTHTLDAGQWLEYFESIGSALDGSLVTIEVMDEQIGDQVEAERLPLQAIGYDPNDNVMEIAVGGRGLRYPVLLRTRRSGRRRPTRSLSGSSARYAGSALTGC